MSEIPDVVQPNRAALFAMAEAMASASNGWLRLARNETDNSPRKDRSAATFLKGNERRMWRDLEVYVHMAEVQSNWKRVIQDVAVQLVQPCRDQDPEAYQVGADTLIAMGRAMYDAEAQADWASLFAVSAPPSP